MTSKSNIIYLIICDSHNRPYKPGFNSHIHVHKGVYVEDLDQCTLSTLNTIIMYVIGGTLRDF